MELSRYLLLLVLFIAQGLWASEPVSTGYFNSIAIDGHDAVSYHALKPSGEALKGEKQYSVDWKGATWHFITEADSKLFAANPERYSPAYNGHCANALSLGEGLIKTSGKHWAIFGDQLYLFYASRGTQRWINGNYKDFKEEADRAWKDILSKRK